MIVNMTGGGEHIDFANITFDISQSVLNAVAYGANNCKCGEWYAFSITTSHIIPPDVFISIDGGTPTIQTASASGSMTNSGTITIYNFYIPQNAQNIVISATE